MPEDTIHLMVDGIMLDYMQDLIAARQPPNLFADGPLEPEDFPVLIQVPKYNLLDSRARSQSRPCRIHRRARPASR